MKLDPISLRLFVAVMETGTIAAAAAREHIATAAASRRISELEGALSAVLFARSNKGTEPTAAARGGRHPGPPPPFTSLLFTRRAPSSG